MLSYMEFLNLPGQIIFVLAALFLFSQIVGELLELQGKVVPEIMKIRKYFARKKKEREIIEKIPAMIEEFQDTMNDFRSHYSADNIAKRDAWMREVNESMREFQDIKEIVLDIQINSKRRDIIEFANRAIDMDVQISEEEYERIFALHDEYEETIKKNNLKNGQIEVSYDLIRKSYEERAKSHSFTEDTTGYRKK